MLYVKIFGSISFRIGSSITRITATKRLNLNRKSVKLLTVVETHGKKGNNHSREVAEFYLYVLWFNHFMAVVESRSFPLSFVNFTGGYSNCTTSWFLLGFILSPDGHLTTLNLQNHFFLPTSSVSTYCFLFPEKDTTKDIICKKLIIKKLIISIQLDWK